MSQFDDDMALIGRFTRCWPKPDKARGGWALKVIPTPGWCGASLECDDMSATSVLNPRYCEWPTVAEAVRALVQDLTLVMGGNVAQLACDERMAANNQSWVLHGDGTNSGTGCVAQLETAVERAQERLDSLKEHNAKAELRKQEASPPEPPSDEPEPTNAEAGTIAYAVPIVGIDKLNEALKPTPNGSEADGERLMDVACALAALVHGVPVEDIRRTATELLTRFGCDEVAAVEALTTLDVLQDRPPPRSATASRAARALRVLAGQ